jgi:hypothetical protein
MTNNLGTFPFGQPIQRVVQQDRSPKKVFVLGVYASAVHARWIGPDGKEVVKALAVASEPYIFWRGDGAADIIKRVAMPKELGTLEPVEDKFDGPSGKALDDLFLKPLGFTRQDAWLCDLVPYSCRNVGQRDAIDRASNRFKISLSAAPDLPDVLADDARRQEILAELRESQARLLVLLGDQPIEWFLWPLDKEKRWKRLADFRPYGQRHKVSLGGLEVEVLPFCHPRQAGKLGMSSPEWAERHGEWVKTRAWTF